MRRCWVISMLTDQRPDNMDRINAIGGTSRSDSRQIHTGQLGPPTMWVIESATGGIPQTTPTNPTPTRTSEVLWRGWRAANCKAL